MRYKLSKFFGNCARDTPLRGVYIPYFDQISVKISVLWYYTLVVAPMGVKFGTEEGTIPSSVPKTAEIDLEKCTFRNFRSSMTLTLDRVEVTLVQICGRGLPTYQIRWKSEKLFVDERMDGRMDGHT